MPPFTGVDAVRGVDGLGNAAGFVPVDGEFRHPQLEEIYSAGVAVAIAPPEPTAVPAGVPKTGTRSRRWPRSRPATSLPTCAAASASACPLSELAAICVLDAGNNGIVFKADHVLARDGEAGHARVMAGPQAHWAKLAFERYFVASRRRGLVTV